jgi:hypothetical protein
VNWYRLLVVSVILIAGIASWLAADGNAGAGAGLLAIAVADLALVTVLVHRSRNRT